MEKLAFADFKEKIGKKEGIVLLGAGGNLHEWINGVADVLKEEDVSKTADPSALFTEKYVLETTGGRTDLALVVDFENVDSGKMAIWRLRFGDCSWIQDYIVNYANQHHGPNPSKCGTESGD